MQLFPDCGCGCKGKEQQKKFIRAMVLGVLFFILANPETFTMMRKVFGSGIASVTGYPTIRGLLLHALVFFLVSWGLMNIGSREKMDGDAPAWATQKSNTSPSAMPLTNWTATDSTGGPPPAGIPEGPVAPSTTLPEMGSGDDSIGMPNTPPQPTNAASWTSMSKGLGGMDLSAPSSMSSSGTNWQTCACPNGKQVMVMN